MRRPKVSLRGFMALVLLIAIALALGIPAVEVDRTKDYHTHTFVDVRGTPTLGAWRRPAPFWPRYARRLLGRPWSKQPVCGPTPGVEAELCEFAHPEMRMEIGGRTAYTFTSEQGDRLEAIEQQRARGKP